MIVLKNVTKRFGARTVIDDISADFESNKIHGIIGRNGSGKTVMFKMICGLLPIDEGEILVGGKRIGRDIDLPDSLGATINEPGFIPNINGYRNLKLLAGIKKRVTDKDIIDAIEKVGLDAKSNVHVSKYSMGMRQRLAIAQAIMENPDLIILDEPMNGLDNRGVEEMRKMFLSLKDSGKTILLASHNREDIEVLCDDVWEMDAGKLNKVR